MPVVSDEIEIAKMALGHLGDLSAITDFTTGSSAQDKALNLFYHPTFLELLTGPWWTFAKKVSLLTGQAVEPNEHWDYSYTLPTDCIYARRIRWYEAGPSSRVEHRQAVVPIEINRRTGLLYTDFDATSSAKAELEYTREITNLSLLPTDFVLAFSYLLASRIAPMVTGGDPFKLGMKAFQQYRLKISEAKSKSYNEEKPDEEHQAEQIRARGE